MSKKTVADIDVKGKRVLVRVDFNLPTDPKTGEISDDSRIRATLPTLKYLLDREARLILCSHLGRPKGRVVDSLRMAPIGERLAKLIEREVLVTSCCIGQEAKLKAEKLGSGEILLLENLRFHPDEEGNGSDFARELTFPWRSLP